MSWDFSTDPRLPGAARLDERVRRREIWPLEAIWPELGLDGLQRAIAPLQEQVKARGLWATHLPPELGGQGMGQVRLGLMHEILGTSPIAPLAFGNAAPDSGNSEILAMAGTPEQKDRWLHPLLAGDLRSAFSMTEPDTPGSDPTQLRTRAVRDGDELGDRRTQVVLLERLDRRLPDRDGGHQPRRAALAAGLDVHRPRRHARAWRSCATCRRWSTRGSTSAATAGTPKSSTTACAFPREALLGREGEGFVLAQQRLGPGRIHHCMRWLGVARRAFDMMCERATYRDAHGSLLAREADGAELDRRQRRRDAGRAPDDAARGVGDGHAGRARGAHRRSR